MIMEKPKKIKLELMDYEIQNIMEVLSYTSHNSYTFLEYQKIVDKLKRALNK